MEAKEYRSSPARLVHLFQRSRNTWKHRAADKQATIKKMRIRVRDLSASRDHWKAVAEQQAGQIASLQEQLPQASQEPSPGGC